ncbi:MAG: type II CAAX endopeptidase family protein [Bryobacteraceae bacterium]|jgi:membrane protease YdiL (CAAX protease family)
MSGPLPIEPPAGEPPAPAAPPRDPYPFWNYVDALLLAALALPMLAAAFVLVTVFFLATGLTPGAKALGPVATTFLFYGFWFLVLFLLIRLRYDRPFWRSLAWVRPRGSLASSAGWGLLAALVSIALGVVLRTPRIRTPLDELIEDPASLVLLGIFAITLGPLCEELAFRGFLLPLLARSFGSVAGVLLQALPFAVLHGFEYSWSWQRLVIILLAGVAFGWMRQASGSTAAAACMHSAYNFTFFAGLLAQRFGH